MVHPRTSMKIIILTAFLAFTCGSALAAGPAALGESAARPASGFELRVPAPEEVSYFAAVRGRAQMFQKRTGQ